MWQSYAILPFKKLLYSKKHWVKGYFSRGLSQENGPFLTSNDSSDTKKYWNYCGVSMLNCIFIANMLMYKNMSASQIDMNKENYNIKCFVAFVLLSQKQWDIFARWQDHWLF